MYARRAMSVTGRRILWRNRVRSIYEEFWLTLPKTYAKTDYPEDREGVEDRAYVGSLREKNIDDMSPYIRETDERNRKTDGSGQDKPNDYQNRGTETLFRGQSEYQSICEQEYN